MTISLRFAARPRVNRPPRRLVGALAAALGLFAGACSSGTGASSTADTPDSGPPPDASPGDSRTTHVQAVPGGTTGSGGASGTSGSGGGEPQPIEKFSFFVTSLKALQELLNNPSGFGGDLRFGETGAGAGLRGADKICATILHAPLRGRPARGAAARRFQCDRVLHARSPLRPRRGDLL